MLCKQKPDAGNVPVSESQDQSEKIAAAEMANDGGPVQSRTSKIYLADSRFSNCIYEEMQIDEIKREYEKTVAEKEQY